MKISQDVWPAISAFDADAEPLVDVSVQLVLAFGSRRALEDAANFDRLRRQFPQAEILMGSSAGEIMGTQVLDDQIVWTAITFEKTKIKSTWVHLDAVVDRHAAGVRLASALVADDLALVLVISDGQNVNGSELVVGLNAILGGKVPVVGGLAGDGGNFEKTLVGLNSAPTSGVIAAIGFYGDSLAVGFGSEGGWEPFGPERTVTKSDGNLLYALDGKSALALYKSYLGERAADLPASGLLFPLSIKTDPNAAPTVRTILNVNEADNSLTFAGDIPVGSTVRMMKAGFDRLITGASDAASACMKGQEDAPSLAILISCVGRKLLLNQRVEEEIEQVAAVLGGAALCGFYSYGELSPASENGFCALHNQTMTITTISER